MAYTSFINALMQAKRSSQLRGIPFSTRDVLNLQSGYLQGAGERASAARSENLAERTLGSQEDYWTKSLGLSKTQAENALAQEKELSARSLAQSRETATGQLSAQEQATRRALTGNILSTGGSLGGAYLVGKNLAAKEALTGTGGMLTAEELAPEAAALAGGAETGPVGATGLAGLSTGAQLATGAGLLYAGTKGAQLLFDPREGKEGAFNIKEYPPELAQAQEFVTDVFEKPIEAIIGGCIIITACTDSHSPEVEIARRYRDEYMTPDELRGYYMMAEKIVPSIEGNALIKKMVKKWLVDPLIEYGKYALKMTKIKPSPYSVMVKKLFLSLCRNLGRTRKQFVRSNGEVF